MVKRNPNLAKLNAGYLFPEVNRRKKFFLQENPKAQLISLGIGDTTEPLSPKIAQALQKAGEKLGTKEGYSGYGPEQGNPLLRHKLAEKIYQNRVQADEIFISDGAKCDIGRLQLLFGADCTMAVQDPSYPAYVDTGVIIGQTRHFNSSSGQYEGISYLKCNPENQFFPDLSHTPRTDIIYFCSPNNPTGAVATYDQLRDLVNFCLRHKSILIFDSAYSSYIQDPNLPKSIYEIPGAQDVAIEIGSFSKMAGFTGVRLGWSVIPESVVYEDGSSVRKDWNRLISTCFNGPSNVAEAGGIQVLEHLPEVEQTISFYLENAKLIKDALGSLRIRTYGGTDAPYIWAHFPNQSSWETFEFLMKKAEIVTTPGSGFGPGGEGFVRFSAFGRRENILEACKRIKDLKNKS